MFLLSQAVDWSLMTELNATSSFRAVEWTVLRRLAHVVSFGVQRIIYSVTNRGSQTSRVLKKASCRLLKKIQMRGD